MRLINRLPGRFGLIAGAAAPFLAVLLLYGAASQARLEENPNDKLLPSVATVAEAVERLAFQPDRRTGTVLLWNDTAASLKRLAVGVAVGALFGLGVGC